MLPSFSQYAPECHDDMLSMANGDDLSLFGVIEIKFLTLPAKMLKSDFVSLPDRSLAKLHDRSLATREMQCCNVE